MIRMPRTPSSDKIVTLRQMLRARGLDPRDFEMQGKLARVTSSIRPGGMGEIVYEQSGARMVRAARSANGAAIARGTEVIVLSADRGVGVVAPWSELYGDHLPPAPVSDAATGEAIDTPENHAS